MGKIKPIENKRQKGILGVSFLISGIIMSIGVLALLGKETIIRDAYIVIFTVAIIAIPLLIFVASSLEKKIRKLLLKILFSEGSAIIIIVSLEYLRMIAPVKSLQVFIMILYIATGAFFFLWTCKQAIMVENEEDEIVETKIIEEVSL